MVRETSKEVYARIVSEGLLSKRRLEVYDILYKFGAMTSGEVFKKIQQQRNVSGLSQSRARFTELREMGAIQEIGIKKCTETGNKVILWTTTDNIPKKFIKPKKNKLSFTKDELNRLVTEWNKDFYAYTLFTDWLER